MAQMVGGGHRQAMVGELGPQYQGPSSVMLPPPSELQPIAGLPGVESLGGYMASGPPPVGLEVPAAGGGAMNCPAPRLARRGGGQVFFPSTKHLTLRPKPPHQTDPFTPFPIQSKPAQTNTILYGGGCS